MYSLLSASQNPINVEHSVSAELDDKCNALFVALFARELVAATNGNGVALHLGGVGDNGVGRTDVGRNCVGRVRIDCNGVGRGGVCCNDAAHSNVDLNSVGRADIGRSGVGRVGTGCDGIGCDVDVSWNGVNSYPAIRSVGQNPKKNK